MTDEIEQGQPEVEQAPAETDGGGETYEMPDKFKGKSAEEVAKSYQELEKELGKKGNSNADISRIENSLNELHQALKSKEEVNPNELESQHKEYLKRLGFSTKEDVEQAKEAGRKEAELDRINETLTDKYNGKDGRPAYDRQGLTDFAKQNGYTSLHPEVVYKLKHEAELRDWDIKQALKGNRSPGVPEGKKGSSSPKGGKDTSQMTEDERREYMKSKFESGE